MSGSKHYTKTSSPSAPIRVSQKSLTGLLDISPDALIVIDRTGTILMVNEQAETLFGYARGELSGQPLATLLPANFHDRHVAHIQGYFAAPRARPMGAGLQLSGRCKDGTEFPVDISLKPVLVGQTLYAVGAVRDVSEQRRMEEMRQQLLQRERQAKEAEHEMAHLRSLFSQAPVIMNIYRGPEHTIEFWHPLARKFVGGRDLTGMKMRDALPEIVETGHIERMDHVYQTGEMLVETEMPTSLKAANGELVEYFFNSICQPWYDLDGKIAGLLRVTLDVTEQVRARRQLEDQARELRRQRDELAQLNANLEKANRGRQFFSTMSHELRTPLASIIGFSQLLLEDAEESGWTQSQKSNLERILKNGQHLLGLINDVLDLVKIEAGRMEINFSAVDVREIITWVVEETSSLAAEKKLDVSVAIEDEVTNIESNPVKLRQVLLNLVSNALKYTERGGVTISAARVGENQLALTVQDTGVGIPEEMQERIFEAFYQVDGGYTRKAGGTGLGLAIVSQLTGLLGGTIELKSVPGQGSAFTVLLPVRQSEQHTMTPRAGWGDDTGLSVDTTATPATIFGEGVEPRTNMAPAEERRDLVLAVDDDLDVIALIRTSLQDSDYSVIGVQDPVRLIELVQKMRPSAITLDVLMPDRSGWQILRQLKSNPATSSIPVIMLSVLSEPDTAYGLGADDYLIKPFQKDTLLKTLQNLVAARRATSRTGRSESAEGIDAVWTRRSHYRT